MTEIELKKYHAAVGDCWQFLKKQISAPAPWAEDYWRDAIDAADVIDKRYNSELITDFLTAIMNELIRTHRRRAKT